MKQNESLNIFKIENEVTDQCNTNYQYDSFFKLPSKLLVYTFFSRVLLLPVPPRREFQRQENGGDATNPWELTRELLAPKLLWP